MKSRAAKQWIAVPALLLLASCGTSPEPDYYSLMPVPGNVMTEPATTIKIERPNLPGTLDRPQFVAQRDDYRTTIDEMNRWSQPLDGMLAGVLEADVQQRLPSSIVVTEDNGALDHPRFVVALSLESYNPIAGGQADMKGELIVKDSRSAETPEHRPIAFTTATGSSPQAVAAALSALAADAADTIATTIAALLSQGAKTVHTPGRTN